MHNAAYAFKKHLVDLEGFPADQLDKYTSPDDFLDLVKRQDTYRVYLCKRFIFCVGNQRAVLIEIESRAGGRGPGAGGGWGRGGRGPRPGRGVQDVAVFY